MQPDDKKTYKEMFSKLSTSKEFVESLSIFLDTYDGTNDDELVKFLITLLYLVKETENLKIIKKGYDQLVALKKQTSEKLSNIDLRYEELEKKKAGSVTSEIKRPTRVQMAGSFGYTYDLSEQEQTENPTKPDDSGNTQ